MKKVKFILAIVLLGIALIGTAQLTPTTAASMSPNTFSNNGGFDDEGVHTFSYQPDLLNK